MEILVPFYKSQRAVERAAYLLFKSDMERGSVTIPSQTSFITKKERSEAEARRKMCDVCGRVTYHTLVTNSCTDHSDWPNRDQAKAHQLRKEGKGVVKTGPDSDRDKPGYIPPMVRVFNPNIERRLRILEAPEIDMDLGEPENIVTNAPDGLHCSFCGEPISESQATMGKGKVRINHVYELVRIGDQDIIEEKTVRSVERLAACPDCCLNIKPTVNKDGRTVTNTVFPAVFD